MESVRSTWAKRSAWSCFVAMLIGIPWCFIHFEKQLKFFKRHATAYKRFIEHAFWIPRAEQGVLPEEFTNVPFGEQTGVVLSVRTLKIPGVLCPYNPALVQRDSGGYHLVFRYDHLDENIRSGLTAHLGLVDLDRNFQPLDRYTVLNTGSQHTEDPRVLRTQQGDFLTYNDLLKGSSPDARGMHLARIDLKNRRLHNIQTLDLKLNEIEKNWVPFEYIDEKQQSHLHFEYSLEPRKLLLCSKNSGELPEFLPFSYNPAIHKLLWPSVWGKLRGGTAAQKVGDEYLAFFHSSFFGKNNTQWFCMGAYTFEGKPPFRVTGISQYPILFDGIYGTPPMNTAPACKRVIYPCGFVMEKRDGRDTILLSCGENDASVKIVVLDKEELFKGLKRVRLKQ